MTTAYEFKKNKVIIANINNRTMHVQIKIQITYNQAFKKQLNKKRKEETSNNKQQQLQTINKLVGHDSQACF